MIESLLLLLTYMIVLAILLYIANWAFRAAALPHEIRIAASLIMLLIALFLLLRAFGVI